MCLKRAEIPSIGELTSFVAAAQHGSFTRAGIELNRTQGAISRQIHELESHLGIRLFERIRQRVVLTDAGRLYLAHVKKALDDLYCATRKVASLAHVRSLNLVVLPTFGTRWLIPRLPKFQERYPGIAIHITTLQYPIDCAVDPFDAAVFHEPYHWPGTIYQHLMDANVVAVCSPKLQAKRAIKTLADFAKFPLLRETQRPNRWSELLAAAGVKLEEPIAGHTYQNYAMVAQAAVSGLGIGLLPCYLVEDDLRSRRLEIVAHDLLDLRTSYHLILPEARASIEAVQIFAKWLVAESHAWHSQIGRPSRKTPQSRLAAAVNETMPRQVAADA